MVLLVSSPSHNDCSPLAKREGGGGSSCQTRMLPTTCSSHENSKGRGGGEEEERGSGLSDKEFCQTVLESDMCAE